MYVCTYVRMYVCKFVCKYVCCMYVMMLMMRVEKAGAGRERDNVRLDDNDNEKLIRKKTGHQKQYKN
jgi:hypothetical protein